MTDIKEKFKITVTQIRIDTNLMHTFFVDIELDNYNLEIFNLIVTLEESITGNYILIEMPKTLNSPFYDEFLAVNFTDKSAQAFVFSQIRAWIEKQSYLMDFLKCKNETSLEK